VAPLSLTSSKDAVHYAAHFGWPNPKMCLLINTLGAKIDSHYPLHLRLSEDIC